MSGVPNTMNVISNFPFLVVGVVGLVLCLHGNYLGLRYQEWIIFWCQTCVLKIELMFDILSLCSLRGEVWGWACFYGGVTATAFGSAYYHLKPDDARLVWDRLSRSSARFVNYKKIASSFVLCVSISTSTRKQPLYSLLLPLYYYDGHVK